MPSWKTILLTVAIAFGTVTLVCRVPPLRKVAGV